MLQSSLLRNALMFASISLLAAGCRCGGTGNAVKPGEIAIVYLEGDKTKPGSSGT